MISPGKIIEIARKWQRLAAVKRKRISLPKSSTNANPSGRCLSPVADKGHFVVYIADRRRFMFPMPYLNSLIFRELLAMSEEGFGLPGNGPITLPCDAVFMEFAVSLIKQRVDKEMEKALVMSINDTISSRRSLPCYQQAQQQSSQHSLVPRLVVSN